MGSQGLSKWVQKMSSPLRFEPRTVQRIEIRYTDVANDVASKFTIKGLNLLG